MESTLWRHHSFSEKMQEDKIAPWGTGRKVDLKHCLLLFVSKCGYRCSTVWTCIAVGSQPEFFSPAAPLSRAPPPRRKGGGTLSNYIVWCCCRYFMESLDEVRQVLLQEPRGYPCQVNNIVHLGMNSCSEPQYPGAALRSVGRFRLHHCRAKQDLPLVLRA